MKNWGVIGGIAAAMAAGVYVLWGPITDSKKRKKGKLAQCLCRQLNTRSLMLCRWMFMRAIDCILKKSIHHRHGTRPAEPGKHLLHELSAPGPGSLPFLRQVAGGVH